MHIIVLLQVTLIACWLISRFVLAPSFTAIQIPATSATISGVMLTTGFVIAAQMAMFGFLTHRYSLALRDSEAQVRASSAAKDQFIATMSHEIRTPLNGLIGMLDIIGSGETHWDHKHALETMKDSSTTLLSMVEDMLDMSRLRSKSFELDDAFFDPFEAIEQLGVLLRPFTEVHGVRLAMECDLDVPSLVRGDQKRFQQVCINVISNAIKYSGKQFAVKNGKVQISVSFPSQKHLEVSVIDNGIGMDLLLQGRAFVPFERGSFGHSSYFQGAGLGLSIASELLEKMNGRSCVQSAPGAGTSVALSFQVTQFSGRRAAPAFQHLRLVLLGFEKFSQQSVFQALATSGAAISTMNLHDKLADVIRRSDSNTIFLANQSSLSKNDERFELKNLFNLFPDIKVLEICDGDVGEPTLDQNRVTIAGNPFVPTDLISGIELISGARLLGDHTEVDASVAPTGENMPKQVLVVDDNAVNRDVLEGMLTRMGHSVTTAQDGVDALELFQNQAFDIVFTDLSMPLMSGRELVSAIRLFERRLDRASTPVFAVTALGNSDEVRKALNAGMNAYLVKPVRLNDLLGIMNKLVGQTNSDLHQSRRDYAGSD